MDEQAYLIFYSHASAYRIEFEKIQRQGNAIEIHYHFVPQFSVEATLNLALIPLGKLPAGNYQVEHIKTPLAQEFIEAGFQPVTVEQVARVVCRPFSFTVEDPFAREQDQPEKRVEIPPTPEPDECENGVEIPLSEIWAWRMPGTRPMNAGLRGGKFISEEGALLDELRKRLSGLPGEGDERKAEPGFIVAGTGMEAMKKAHAVLMGKEDRQEAFEESEKLSLVFFTYRSTWYVHLQHIVIEGDTIRIRFNFVPHQSKNLTNHFALIPIGDLKVGEYKVIVERLPLEEKYVKLGWPPRPASSDKLVSGSFSFTIGEPTIQAGQHNAVSPQPAGENHDF